MERWKPKRCYKCKSEELREITAEDRIEVAGLTFTASIPAIKCATCGEETYAGPDLGAFEVAVAGELARHGVISAEAFAFMRRAIGMQARDLAELLDVAPETISRWEHGKRQLERGPFALLAEMVLDRLEGRTVTFDRLRALVKPEPLPRIVKLTPQLA
jgi:putative zinc finger/helix-turn-helix YgiT family protein